MSSTWPGLCSGRPREAGGNSISCVGTGVEGDDHRFGACRSVNRRWADQLRPNKKKSWRQSGRLTFDWPKWTPQSRPKGEKRTCLSFATALLSISGRLVVDVWFISICSPKSAVPSFSPSLRPEVLWWDPLDHSPPGSACVLPSD